MLCNLGPCPRPVRGGVVVVWAVRVWARWYIYDICMFPYFELRAAALFPIWITAPVLGPGNHNKADQKDANSGGPPCLHPQGKIQNCLILQAWFQTVTVVCLIGHRQIFGSGPNLPLGWAPLLLRDDVDIVDAKWTLDSSGQQPDQHINWFLLQVSGITLSEI